MLRKSRLECLPFQLHYLSVPCGALTVIGVSTLPRVMEAAMGVKEIPGYICLARAVVSFITMYLIPAVNRRKSPGKRNPARGEERLIWIEERTGLMNPSS